MSEPEQSGRKATAAPNHHADRSVWLIWMGLVLVAVAILPFALRNSEVLRQIAAMCGFNLG